MECTLYLTENCNLKCNYCYEGNDKRSKTLNNQDLEKAISFIVQNNPQNENINLTFLGGEPLLNKDAIYLCMDIINHKWSQSKELFKFHITTNGILLDKEIIKLFKENFKNMFSHCCRTAYETISGRMGCTRYLL